MTVRVEVQTLVGAGPFPSADDATEEELEAIVRWLEQIPRPVTDEEAVLLSTAFGPDDCYGLSWSLLHLIETAPNALHAHYPHNTENVWVQELAARVDNARRNPL